MEQTSWSITASAATSFLRPNYKITGYSNEILGQIATNSGISFNSVPDIVADRIDFGQQENSGISFNSVPDIVADRIDFGQQENLAFLINSIPAPVANMIDFGQQENSRFFINPITDTPNVLSENASSDFLTLGQFVKEETEFTSIDQFIVSEKELAWQFVKIYLQKSHTPLHTIELVQLISLVLVLTSSIFSQQFGGNRNLPVV